MGSPLTAGARGGPNAVPLPKGQRVKTVSLAPNENGAVDIAFSSVARDRTSNDENKGAGGWWQLRTIQRTDDGHWLDPTDVLCGVAGWACTTAQ